jgi:hypothetical protein
MIYHSVLDSRAVPMCATQVIGVIEIDVPDGSAAFDDQCTGCWPASRETSPSDQQASYTAVVANLSHLSSELRVELDRLQQRLAEARRRRRESNQAC